MNKLITTTFILLFGLNVSAQELIQSEKPEPTSNALFGWASAVHENYAVITAPQFDLGDKQSVGQAYLYRWENDGWIIQEAFLPDGLSAFSNFGISAGMRWDQIALGSLGDPERGLFSGAVYLYNYSDTSITQVQKLTPSDASIGSQFGYSLEIEFFENILAVGAYQADGIESKSGAVYIFKKNESGEYEETQKLTATDGQTNDYFGHEVTFLNWDLLAVSAYNADGAAERSGAVYIFKKNEEGVWVEQAKLFDPNGASSDLFGYSIARTNEVAVPVKSMQSSFWGNLFVGAPGTNQENGQSGSVYIFEENENNEWVLAYQIIEQEAESNDHFGVSVAHNAINGLFVGASRDGLENSGKIYNYNITWSFNPDRAVEQIPFKGGESITEYYGSKLTATGYDFPQLIFSSPYQTVDGKNNAGAVEFYYTIISSNEEDSENIENYRLGQNYPNPFNPSTAINYTLKEDGLVKLTVFNLLGQEIQSLVNEKQVQGTYTVNFDAGNLASGFYFYRLEVNDFVSSRKMLLIK